VALLPLPACGELYDVGGSSITMPWSVPGSAFVLSEPIYLTLPSASAELPPVGSIDNRVLYRFDMEEDRGTRSVLPCCFSNAALSVAGE
jgi:hypothetical protein